MLPTANMIYNGNTSPRNPYMTVEIAVPPTLADCMNPRIVPLFSSGRASISEALKIVFPAVFKNAPIKTKMHIVRKSVDRYANTKKISDSEKPIAKVQKRAFGDSLTTPKISTHISDATVHTDIIYPYVSTEKPFSIVNGRIRENGPAESRFSINIHGTNRLR